MPATVRGRPMIDWLTTTTHHDLHHAQPDSNFGLYFTWWDRWMGTENPGLQAAFARAAFSRATAGAHAGAESRGGAIFAFSRRLTVSIPRMAPAWPDAISSVGLLCAQCFAAGFLLIVGGAFALTLVFP
jgi:hypothetical protein